MCIILPDRESQALHAGSVMTKYFTVLEHLLSVLGQLPWDRTGQVKVPAIKNSFLLVMITEDWNIEKVVQEDILFFSLSVTSSA